MGTAAHLPTKLDSKSDAYVERVDWWTPCFRRALPVLPNTLFQTNAVLSSSPANLGRLVAIVGDDPAMAANLLREARAVEPDQPSDHLVDIIIGIGVQRLQALLLRTPLLTDAEAKSPRYLAWRAHSVLVSVLAETIANTCLVSGGRLARTAGLLHDIGELPLILRNHTEQSVGMAYRATGSSDAGAHCDIGHELARTWCFSVELTTAIHEHHGDDVDKPSLLAVVATADRVSHSAGVGIDERMARTYAGTTVEHLANSSLQWLTSGQRLELVLNVRRAYQHWRRSHPGLGVPEI